MLFHFKTMEIKHSLEIFGSEDCNGGNYPNEKGKLELAFFMLLGWEIS